MLAPSRLLTFVETPRNQALLAAALILILTLFDLMMPHQNNLLEAHSGSWIVATAMVLCYVILNALVALKVEQVVPYWSQSVMYYLGLLAFTYGWCFLLSGKQIDEVGSFRWLWFVLTMVYMVFFVIARSIKRIIDIANRQDERLRGE